ncbi:MAG: hypothetical protein HFE73_02730 [Firmicutes bacterium]|nr:hypothetical protein [Bacillota bacterium]
MKNLIIIIGTIILGAVIVNTLVLGDGISLKTASEKIVEHGSNAIMESLHFGQGQP